MPHELELYGRWLRRDLSQRYAGSALGPLWLLLQPLSFIVVITLVFNGFFQTKWPGGDGSALDYGLKVFVGLAVHNFLAEALTRTPNSILSHAYLVTKVRFPLLLLPAVACGVALVQLLLTFVVVMVAAFAWGGLSLGQVLQSWWALPLALAPSVLLVFGLGWFLAGLGTYLRDVSNLMPAVSGLLMFLMPVFYPAEMVPPALAWLVDFNPLAWAIESARGILFQGVLPDLGPALAHTVGSACCAGAGWWFFNRVRSGFADVL